MKTLNQDEYSMRQKVDCHTAHPIPKYFLKVPLSEEMNAHLVVSLGNAVIAAELGCVMNASLDCELSRSSVAL